MEFNDDVCSSELIMWDESQGSVSDRRDDPVTGFNLLLTESRSCAAKRSSAHKQDNDNKEVDCCLTLRNVGLCVV